MVFTFTFKEILLLFFLAHLSVAEFKLVFLIAERTDEHHDFSLLCPQYSRNAS
jgi:hypothetical protein